MKIECSQIGIGIPNFTFSNFTKGGRSKNNSKSNGITENQLLDINARGTNKIIRIPVIQPNIFNNLIKINDL